MNHCRASTVYIYPYKHLYDYQDPGNHDHYTGHNKHAGHSLGMFNRRFFGSLLLTLPILYFSLQLQD